MDPLLSFGALTLASFARSRASGSPVDADVDPDASRLVGAAAFADPSLRALIRRVGMHKLTAAISSAEDRPYVVNISCKFRQFVFELWRVDLTYFEGSARVIGETCSPGRL